ncbi:transporter substrate-binding domain-containing protein [Aquipseudomonas guryensis]|uniref:Transporter substrate-binding domain-containing protein n=1 Tax=Aquipseudomonas guryensis TaxID=2759165 RepID=A0A7W4D8V2_9GAMM|nr:transporter substrate-binding domain-containing protein [Pseudomonas guryensis]MBB1518130.1 transporter substrate-binding domain-containing protein [Pseudomonas guryensis]
MQRLWRLFPILLLVLASTRLAAAPLQLEPELQQWLASHPTINWAAEADYAPFIFVDPQRQAQGLSHDVLRALQERLDLPLQQKPALPLNELLDQARRGHLDLLTSLRPTAERAEYLAFTSPYVEVPTVLVVRGEQRTSLTLKQLAGMRVAVGDGYAVERFVRDSYPTVQWLALPTDRAGLQALQQRQVAAVVMDLGSASYLLKEEAFQDLQIGTKIGFNYPLSFAYRKDWPELGRILEAGLHSLSLAEREELMQPWLEQLPGTSQQPGSLLLAAVAMGLLALTSLLVFLAYRRQRRAQPS